jgi:hypothetical protein
MILNPGVYLEKGFQILDRIVQHCMKAELYVILDLHAVPGGQTKIATQILGVTKLYSRNLRISRIASFNFGRRLPRDTREILMYVGLFEPYLIH